MEPATAEQLLKIRNNKCWSGSLIECEICLLSFQRTVHVLQVFNNHTRTKLCWKNSLRKVSVDSKHASCELQVMSCELRLKKTKLRVTSWNTRVARYKLQFNKQKARVANRVAKQKCVLKIKARVENKSTRNWSQNLKFITNITCITLIWFMKMFWSPHPLMVSEMKLRNSIFLWVKTSDLAGLFQGQLWINLWKKKKKNSIDHAHRWRQKEIWKNTTFSRC